MLHLLRACMHMQVDVYVMVADAQGVVLDCKDYLAPIITPYEAALAFTGRALALPRYRLDMRAALVRDTPSTTHHPCTQSCH